MKLKIGTRGSNLALWQAYHVKDLLVAAHPGLDVEIKVIVTKGDRIQNTPLPEIGGKGLFTEAIETQLWEDQIHVAVHSLKDLPGELPPGLVYAGSPARADARDVFISHKWDSFGEVPERGTLATGSSRRKALLAKFKPELNFADLRGNIETRLRKLLENDWDGIIMAAAALERLGKLEHVRQYLPLEDFVPAVGQGAIGLEIKESRIEIAGILQAIGDENTIKAVTAERSFMKHLEGGCSVPLGAYAEVFPDHIRLRGFLGSSDGKSCLQHQIEGQEPEEMGKRLAEYFWEQGASRLLCQRQ